PHQMARQKTRGLKNRHSSQSTQSISHSGRAAGPRFRNKRLFVSTKFIPPKPASPLQCALQCPSRIPDHFLRGGGILAYLPWEGSLSAVQYLQSASSQSIQRGTSIRDRRVRAESIRQPQASEVVGRWPRQAEGRRVERSDSAPGARRNPRPEDPAQPARLGAAARAPPGAPAPIR